MKARPKRQKRRTPVEMVRAVFEHLAITDGDAEPTSEVKRWAREQHTQMQERITQMRRQHAERKPAIGRAPPVGAEIQAMTRADVLARLEALGRGGAVQVAHRKLTRLTDDDLRQMLAILLAAPPES